MGRKILPLFLVITMIFSLVGFNAVSHAAVLTDFAGGLGTEENPWQIATAVQLNNVRYYLGREHHDKHFILTEDINLNVYPFNDGKGWEPIGDWWSWDNHAFQGSLDGAGHTISGLYINMPVPTSWEETEYYAVGLFGATQNATIKNIYLTDVNVTGYDLAGGLVGDAELSVFSDIHVTGSVIGNSAVGGIAGFTYRSYIVFSSFNGSVNAVNDLGGLVGYFNDSSIRYSLSKGIVNGNMDVGGLVGFSSKSSISESHSESLVTGTEYAVEVGGLVGYNYNKSTISKSYATGAVSGYDHVGGLVGENAGYSKITDSYAWGAVSIDGVDDPTEILTVGGLVGYNNDNSTVQNCYALGNVSGTGLYHGGLVGENEITSPILSSYSLGPDNGFGTVVTDAEMQIQGTFVDWDFTNTWVLDEGYPYLLPSGVSEIISLEDFTPIVVLFGTPLSNFSLPLTVFATLDDTTIVPLQVTWDGGTPIYDGNTKGNYLFTGTLAAVEGIVNISGLAASITVTVSDPPKEIISVETQTDIIVPNGTVYSQINFPTTVVVTLDDYSITSLEVVWDFGIPDYNGNITGTYVFKGTLVTGNQIVNTNEIYASVKVIVEAPADSPPVVTDHPEDISVKAGESATFYVGYTAKPEPVFQWQYSKNGGKKWINIPGANSDTYEVTQTTIEMDGYQYRVILDNGIGTPVTSNVAMLSVTIGVADIQISQTDGAYDPVTNEIVWTIIVYNNGPETAQGVVIKDTLANNTKLLSVVSDYEYSMKGKTVTVNVGELEANREIVIEIRVFVTRVTSLIKNVASVTSTSQDLNLENNASSSEVLIQ